MATYDYDMSAVIVHVCSFSSVSWNLAMYELASRTNVCRICPTRFAVHPSFSLHFIFIFEDATFIALSAQLFSKHLERRINWDCDIVASRRITNVRSRDKDELIRNNKHETQQWKLLPATSNDYQNVKKDITAGSWNAWTKRCNITEQKGKGISMYFSHQKMIMSLPRSTAPSCVHVFVHSLTATQLTRMHQAFTCLLWIAWNAIAKCQ